MTVLKDESQRITIDLSHDCYGLLHFRIILYTHQNRIQGRTTKGSESNLKTVIIICATSEAYAWGLRMTMEILESLKKTVQLEIMFSQEIH